MASSGRALHPKTAGQRQGRRDHVALVQRMLRRDEPAIAHFYETTSGLLFGLVLRTLRDTASAEQVLARVYADIRQHAAQFDQRCSCLLVWLITITHWHASEHLRSVRTSERFAALIGSGDGQHWFLQNPGTNRSEHQRLISATLASLSPTQLQMIELAYFSRMSPLEIALRLGQRLETVKVGLQDGMSKLCKLFKNDGPAHANYKTPVISSQKTGH